MVIGQVLTCEKHPNSDHLSITTVDLGTGQPQQIVCGAPNLAAGQKVVVATIGTKLYSGDEAFTIKKSKIRGSESNGMICAEDEIGISTSHDGIIVLPGDAVVGTPAADYYKIESDYVLEVDLTPNRIDAASHYGVARDLAAYLKQNGLPYQLTKPSVDDFRIDDPSLAITVEVENTTACPRYSGITIKGVEVKESPEWLKNSLQLIGIRPINNIVDITNYVLHETGHPLHAFDAGKVKGGKVIVKTLPGGTKFITLDEVERKLTKQDLMICNTEAGMCIAGVFGGMDSGVTEATTDIFLESAYFNPTWVRKTARRHGLSTDSSFRFERGADPNNTLYNLKRAALLIKEVAGGSITGDIQDVYPIKINNYSVELDTRKVSSLIGKHISEATIESILDSLEIAIVEKDNHNWKLSVPTYRVDVTRDVDVIEDILRIYGYNNIAIGEEMHSSLSYETPVDRSYKTQQIISEQLTGAGFNEIMNNSFTSGAYYADLVSYPKERCVLLRNPLSAELDVMRQTLLFGGLESIVYNRNRKNPDIKFYEFGNVYAQLPERRSEDDYLSAIRENLKLALWISGKNITNNWMHADQNTSVYELKAFVENILYRLGIDKKTTFKPAGNELFSAALSVNAISGKEIGILGVVSKDTCKRFDIDAEVYFAELDWKSMMKESAKTRIKATDIPKFPEVKRDLALLVDKDITFAQIEKIAYDTEKKLLKDVTLFDVYEGKNLPESKKSYAVSFILQDAEKTLTDKQIEGIMGKIQRALEEKLQAQLR